MNTVQVNDTEYRMSHGHAPRGRGGWLFCNAFLFNDPDYYKHCENFNGTYTEARKQAVAWAKENHIVSIVVCP